MELGITTFAEVTEPGVSPGERLRQVVEEAVLAEQVGLSVYGVGEHHRAGHGRVGAGDRARHHRRADRADPADQRGDGAQLRRPRAGVPGLRHPRPAVLGPGRADGRARVVHGVVPAVRLLPRRLRRAVRREARPAARAARRTGRRPGRAGSARRCRTSWCTRGPSGRCPSGSRSAARPSRSSAPAPSGCRWRWRSSAGSGRRSPRTPTSTAARWSTARPTRPPRSPCTATATSASTRRPGGREFLPRYRATFDAIGRERGWPRDVGRGHRGPARARGRTVLRPPRAGRRQDRRAQPRRWGCSASRCTPRTSATLETMRSIELFGTQVAPLVAERLAG